MILIETQKEEFNRIKDIKIFGKNDNENDFNGDLLVIGLGGIGARVVCNLKGMLINDISYEDNINFLMIDSDIPAMEQTIEDSKEGIGLNALEVISIYRPNIANILANGIEENPKGPNLAKWMRRDFPAMGIGTDGARGNRQIGRLMFSNAYEDMRIMLFEKLKEVYNKSKTGKLDVIIVSSVCGGTGSGILADLTYNIKAYARAKKWTNFRIGGCLLMPDIFFSNKAMMANEELIERLKANGCATLKEIDYLMRVANRGEGFVFESCGHRLSMRENIFDSCMLVSGKKDEQGYIPEGIICNDVAYFIKKLAYKRYIGLPDENGDRKLLRDTFFDREGEGYFKVVNEADYKIPIKEIENICEYEIYKKAKEILYKQPYLEEQLDVDMKNCLSEINEFLSGQPGDEVKLNLFGLIKPAQYEKPQYKYIKKGTDDLRTQLPRQLSRIKSDVPIFAKSIKNKLCASLDEYVIKYMKEFGPFITVYMIGAEGTGDNTVDGGMIVRLKRLEGLLKKYKSNGDFERIVESIRDMAAKKFFALPSAKRETENGYYDACIKDALEKERTMLVDAINSYDVIGDAIRLLRQKAEHLNELYDSFTDDLDEAIKELSEFGDKTTGYLLKGNKRHEFLPSDYISSERVEEIRKKIVDLLIEHENDIDNGRTVGVKEHLEKAYRNVLMGLGAYAPEKFLAVSFAQEKPNLQKLNMMFASPSNEEREEIMRLAAKSFVECAWKKTQNKNLCVLNDKNSEHTKNRKFISLPDGMPYFSEALKEVLTQEPYNEKEDSIAVNAGELEINMDEIVVGVPLSMLACAKEMQEAYDKVDVKDYKGLHTDEVMKDMRAYPNLI